MFFLTPCLAKLDTLGTFIWVGYVNVGDPTKYCKVTACSDQSQLVIIHIKHCFLVKSDGQVLGKKNTAYVRNKFECVNPRLDLSLFPRSNFGYMRL